MTRLTRRGRALLWILVIAALVPLYVVASATPDMCLTRSGYVNCTSLSP